MHRSERRRVRFRHENIFSTLKYTRGHRHRPHTSCTVLVQKLGKTIRRAGLPQVWGLGSVQPPLAVSFSAAGLASRPRGNAAGTRAQGRSVLRPIVCPVALRLTKVEAHHSSVNLRPRPSPKSHPLGLCAPPACSKQDMAELTMTYYASTCLQQGRYNGLPAQLVRGDI